MPGCDHARGLKEGAGTRVTKMGATPSLFWNKIRMRSTIKPTVFSLTKQQTAKSNQLQINFL